MKTLIDCLQKELIFPKRQDFIKGAPVLLENLWTRSLANVDPLEGENERQGRREGFNSWCSVIDSQVL